MSKEKRRLIINWSVRLGLLILAIFGMTAVKKLQENPDFCEAFVRSFSRGYVRSATFLTGLLPFSLTEVGYYLGAIYVIYFVVSTVRLLVKRNFTRAIKRAVTLVTVVAFCVTLYGFVFTLGYSRHSVADYLNLPSEEISLSNCADASSYFADECVLLSDKFEFDEKGDVVCPYTFGELVEMINEEYHRFDGGYLSDFEVRAKPILSSKLMSYSGLTGQFFCLFGESNVSTDLPAYQLPETIAHEIAHAKGVSRENEANFIAYYLLLTSDNDYLRYCGLMTASNRMLSEAYDTKDTTYYYKAAEHFTDGMWQQYQNANDHWNSYDTFWDDFVDRLNDKYLKSSGQTDGVKAYSDTGRFLLSVYYLLIGE